MLPIIIIAGGLATRLYPITKTIPKSLIEIPNLSFNSTENNLSHKSEKTKFISYQLDLLRRNDVTDVILCVGKFGEQIEEYVGDGSKWGLKVRYSYDGDTLVGTGGAIKKALPMLMDTFMVMYGDSYLNVDFKSIVDRFEKEEKQGLMTVYRNEDKWDKSNILFEDGRIVRYDKKNPTSEMKYIDYGLSILRKDDFNGWEDVFDLSDVFVELIEKGEMVGVEVFERFYEIGSVEGIREFKRKIWV